MIGCTSGALISGLKWRESIAVGVGMNARGGMEIIVALIGLSLGVLYLPPILIALTVTNPVWLHRLQRYTPMTAGLTIQNTTGLHGLPITPWAGLGVLALWAAAALLTGGLLLKVRDA